jgi:hypothetical protein
MDRQRAAQTATLSPPKRSQQSTHLRSTLLESAQQTPTTFRTAPGMVNLPINVRVRESCVDRAMTFAGLMANELSHIVLHSMRHKEERMNFTPFAQIILG